MERAVRRGLVPRRAAIAVVTGVAILGVGGGTAGATHVASTIAAVSKPTLGVGQSNQAAGNLTITPGAASTFAVGEKIVVSLDDSDAGANCVTASDFVAFTVAPAVAVTGTATVSTTLTPTGGCGATRTDSVTILVTGAGTISQILVSNVRYDVGSGASQGDVKLLVTGDAPLPTLAPAAGSNATLATVRLFANLPPVGLRAGSGIQAVSILVVGEQFVDAISSSGAQTVCIRLDAPLDTFDTTAPAPTVAISPASGDTATVSLPPASLGKDIQLVVTDISNADNAASTFTISGVRVSAATTSTTGPVTASLLVGPCATATLAYASNIVVAGVVDTERFGGSDRFTTAQILFEDAFPAATCPVTGIANVIIARGDAFPDALAASYLAGKGSTGILLVDPRTPNALPTATVNALRNRGVDTVTIVGGETAIPATIATLLDNLPNVTCAGVAEVAPASTTINVTRIDGGNRYETARNVAERPGLGVAGTADYDGTSADPDGAACLSRKTALLATGENFPDALVAGAVAYGGANVVTNVPPGPAACGDGQGFPLILTTGNALHPQAAAALNNLGIQQVLIMGGDVAITPAVVTAVQGVNGITTRRFDGTSRLDTAKRFAEFAIDFLGYDDDAVSVATGGDFPDALAGAPHAVQNADVGHAAILLTDSATSAGADTLTFFRDRQGVSGTFGRPTPLDVINEIDVYGGATAVADSTVAAILAAISQA